MTPTKIISPGGINANVTPFAFQYWAKDFYEAYQAHRTTRRFSPARLYLLSRSIELALKSLHLAQGGTIQQLRRVGHDLEKACDATMLQQFGTSVSATEETELKKANAYYKNKGFEYFLFRLPGVPEDRSGPQLALSGYPDLPNTIVLEAFVEKLLQVHL